MSLRRPTYSGVASTLALAIALSTGGAYAAGQVKTSDLANNAVTSTKIKNGAVGSADLASNSVSSTKIKNGSIAAGDLQSGVNTVLRAGQPGAPLRSGTKLTGSFYDYDKTGADGGYLVMNADFGGLTPSSLTDATVNFAPDSSDLTSDDDPTCTGSFVAPTAPAGKVCVYVGNISGLTGVDGETWSSSDVARRAFYVYGAKTANATFSFYATWAYTVA